MTSFQKTSPQRPLWTVGKRRKLGTFQKNYQRRCREFRFDFKVAQTRHFTKEIPITFVTVAFWKVAQTRRWKRKTATKRCGFSLESGDDLSSRRLSASTFGVRKLNFCVRNGNRWILSAIITTMVYCKGSSPSRIGFCVLSRFPLFQERAFVVSFSKDLQLHSNTSRTLKQNFRLVKIIDFCEKIR